MKTVKINEFEQNIGSYFDDVITTKEPICIQREDYRVLFVPVKSNNKKDSIEFEDFSLEERKQLEKLSNFTSFSKAISGN